jgi:hypothetical protein
MKISIQIKFFSEKPDMSEWITEQIWKILLESDEKGWTYPVSKTRQSDLQNRQVRKL